ncbi:hypothetical protein [Demetria terragena]|uniref:hypothetical protein n=1 Tax=Demetria terragena TaxID=63959 RepID=UPI0003709BAA|nr:hypothetical protein [Demetria terragena]
MTQTATRSLTDLRDLLRQHEDEPVSRGLPVHHHLAEAFPRGLRPGAVYQVSGSTAIAVALLAAASQQGWCAAVGLPDVSLEAAARWGTALDQLILVPRPGHETWDVVGTLIDAVDLILVASAPIAPAQARRLEARLRARQVALIVLGLWPQATATIEAKTTGWVGLGHGDGCLTEQHLEVTVTEKHRQRTSYLTVPERP